MSDRFTSREEVAEQGRIRRMGPTESDLMSLPGVKHTRKYRPDGTYEWSVKYKPHENGKPTRAGAAVLDMMKPELAASSDLHSRKEVKRPQEALRDGNGAVHFIDPSLAKSAAERNRWSPVRNVGGSSCGWGIEGMAFRWEGTQWYPLGVRCLGTPLTGRRELPKKGLYHDPDGFPWRWHGGEWWRVY